MLRNRSAEKDIRDYLSTHGYYGQSARFDELELHAVGRPGWVQVFRFIVEAKRKSGTWHSLLGVLRDDERTSSKEFVLCESAEERSRHLATWSKNLIVARNDRGDTFQVDANVWKQLIVVLLVFVLGLALIARFF